MTKTPRWIAPMIKEAQACTAKLPWERGPNRAAWIAKRKAELEAEDQRLSA